MPKIVFDGDENVYNELNRVAGGFNLSKVKTLQLAVAVLAKLSDEIGSGTELVLRRAGGNEVELWLPHLRQLPTSPKKQRRK